MNAATNYAWNDASLLPRGGWQYIQPETECRFQNNILDLVVGQVSDHRAANNLPAGNPRQDIENFTCAKQDLGRCQPLLSEEELAARDSEASELLSDVGLKKEFNIDDVMRFLGAVRAALGEKGLVDEETANRRAITCASCPLNVGMSGCFVCTNLASTIFSIIGARQTVRDASLANCGVCGCNLKAKVWLPQDVAEKASDGYRFPSWCWLNTSGSSGQQPETPASQEG